MRGLIDTIGNSRAFLAAEVVFAILGFMTATIAVYEFLIADRSLPRAQAQLSVCFSSSGVQNEEQLHRMSLLHEAGNEMRDLGVFLDRNQDNIVFLDIEVHAACMGDPEWSGAGAAPELYGPESAIKAVSAYLDLQIKVETATEQASDWMPTSYNAIAGKSNDGKSLLFFHAYHNPPNDHMVEVSRNGETYYDVAKQYRALASGYSLLIRHSDDDRATLADRRLDNDYGDLRLIGAYRVRAEAYEDTAEFTIFPMDYDTALARKATCSKALIDAATPTYFDEKELIVEPGIFAVPLAYFGECVLP